MYRSFVTCDDPKGVVEGKTIKKSKIDPRNNEDHKVDDPKDFAKDFLLKGAFNLQESLVMLGKLQEASENMTELKKKEFDATGVGRTKSERVFADHRYNNKVEFEKPRLSVDHSRDCYDELREVIRDSLARQNLLPPCCVSEKARFYRGKVDLSQDFPSTSCSSSTESPIEKACVVYGRKLVMSPELPSTSSSKFASFDCSPSKIQKEKPKVPNLIARLMGLEEIPSTSLYQKELEKDKIFKQRRPIFEIDLPKAKRLPEADPKRRTLDGIIETMLFKGLLRSKSSDVISHQSNVSHLMKNFADDAPPIVIMKPVYTPELQAERFSTSIGDENPSDTKDSFGKWNLNEENSPVNFTTYRKLHTRKVEKSSFSREKGSNDHRVAPAGQKTNEVSQGKLPSTKNRAASAGKTKQTKKEVIEKRVERTQRAPGAKKSVEMKNSELNDTTKFQDQSKRTTAKVRKPEKKSIAPEKVAATSNSNISKCITAVASHNSTKRKKNVKTDKSVKSSSIVPMVENMEHKDDNIQIVHTVERDSDITITEVTSSEKLLCEEVTEIIENVVIERECDFPKDGAVSIEEETCDLDGKGAEQVNGFERRNKEQFDCIYNQQIDMQNSATNFEIQSDGINSNEANWKEQNLDALELDDFGAGKVKSLQPSNDHKNAESSAAESTVPSIQSNHDIPLMEHTSYQIHLDSTEKKNLKCTAATRCLLLSSESFLSRAEELFDTDAWEPTLWKTISLDNEMSNSTLVLDCATELLENKRSHRALAISKDPVNMSRVSISFDKLVNEICDAIEVLKSYTKVDGNSLSVDTLYALHERDIWCNAVVSTTWDLGWKNAFTLDEVEQVTTDIEKHVLNGIIDDVLTDFTL
ncbi:hypothetical protein RND71_037353 [Anisodus tanguticus]|uniref:DUF3741 domain-containing protein n=1 Tax=Anisodus tanguticus TaxID=243964 RepID=A0AAE1V0N1_9SOLA|nr:hypothetical protein RND71_037353 [Anisodus tanguticus]